MQIVHARILTLFPAALVVLGALHHTQNTAWAQASSARIDVILSGQTICDGGSALPEPDTEDVLVWSPKGKKVHARLAKRWADQPLTDFYVEGDAKKKRTKLANKWTGSVVGQTITLTFNMEVSLDKQGNVIAGRLVQVQQDRRGKCTTTLDIKAKNAKAAPPVKADPKKADPKKVDPKKADPKDDPKKDDPKKDDPKKDGAAGEPTAEQMEEAKNAFLEGRRLFDEKQDYQGAVTQFKKSYRLSRNPLLLYNIGYTLDEMKEASLAIFYYEKFLKDSPRDAANRDHAKLRLKALGREVDADSVFDKTDKTTDKTDKTDKVPDKVPDKTPEITTFKHMAVEEAPPGKPLDITAFVPEKAKWQVKLFFRGPGAAKFESTEMQPRYNELVGRIPPQMMAGTSIQYYIEAKDQKGKIVARSGKSTSPNLVFIDASAKPRYYPDLTTDRSWDGAGTSHVSHRKITPGGGPSVGWGRFSDTDSKKFKYVKWGTTGTAATLLTLSVTFYFIAANSASTLEAEAEMSNTECAAPPCRAFSDHQKSIEDYGQRFETMTNVALGLGVVTAGVAGYLWYKEIKDKRVPKGNQRFATPVVGKDFLGAAATVRF